MPILDNPKHEEFALLLARGLKQGDAYVRAGYSENKGAASRLAKTDRICKRVEEHRKELNAKIQQVMRTDNTEEGWETLAEMGLTMNWVASSFQNIYEASMQAGSFAAANSAVSSIQKLIEMEKNANNGEDAADKQESVNIDKLAGILSNVTDLVKASKAPDLSNKPLPEIPAMKDITPDEDDDE